MALAAVARSQLCVTEGAIEQSGTERRWSVSVSKMRAYVNFITEPVVEVRFRYLGPTADDVPLGSGTLRRQFGLKLRAQDPCNLVYAMWRIQPESKLVVSIKSNPGQRTSAQCGNRGYRNIKARRSVPLPALGTGVQTLRAEMDGPQLRVFADNKLVWDGSVAPDALQFDGPVGIRSDNVRLEIELLAGPALKAAAEQAPGSRSSLNTLIPSAVIGSDASRMTNGNRWICRCDPRPSHSGRICLGKREMTSAPSLPARTCGSSRSKL